MKMKAKRILSLVLALATVLGLVSVSVAPSVSAAGTDGLVLSKNVTLQADGTYTINLSGFATGSTTTTQVEEVVPLDIVLVLDASGSMLWFKNTPDTYSCFVAPDGWNDTTTAGTVNGYRENASYNTNLWRSGTMSRKARYYDGSKWMYYVSKPKESNQQSLIRGSVTIPVKPGDKIYCSSFRASSDTGAKDSKGNGIDGIPVTFFRSSGKVLKTMTAAEVYSEYSSSKEYKEHQYITVPESAYIMNIPAYYSDTGDDDANKGATGDKLLEAKTIYNLSLGETRGNPRTTVEFNALPAKILQEQVQNFVNTLAEHGKKNNVNHKVAVVTFAGGAGDGVNDKNGSGAYYGHVGVNGYSDYIYTNTGMFVNGTFKNYMNAKYLTPNPENYPEGKMPYSYAPVYAADLDTTKNYTYFYGTGNGKGGKKTATYDETLQKWVDTSDGSVLYPMQKPYDKVGRSLFYTRERVAPATLSDNDFKSALTDLLVDGAINPNLQKAIDSYVARGTTYTPLGLNMADDVLRENGYKTDGSGVAGRQAAVILFTDGNTDDKDGNKFTTMFYNANYIKARSAKLYTISCADATESSAMAKWMDQVSSNYTTIYRTDTGSLYSHSACSAIYDSTKAVTADSQYYHGIEDISKLENVFTTITSNLTTSTTTVALDGKAVMQDYLPKGLKLPDNFDFSNIAVSVKHVTTTDDENYTFGNVAVTYNNNGKAIEPTTTGNVTSAKILSSTGGSSVTVSYDKVTGMVSVSGFNYANWYVAKGREEGKGRALVVKITGVEATEELPTDIVTATNTNQSGVAFTDASGKAGLYPFTIPQTYVGSKTYVMDYAKTMTMTFTPEELGATAVLGVADNDHLNLNVAPDAFTTEYGDFLHSESSGVHTVTFTPTSMNWGRPASFYALCTLEAADVPEGVTTGTNQWVRINVVPANNIYYEDDFSDIIYNQTDEASNVTSGWTAQSSTENNTENHEGAAGDADGVHGWEGNLVDKTFSDGSVHSADVTDGKRAEAKFTFTGTAVDVYGYTTGTTGTVLVTLQGKSAGGKTVSKAQVVDTQSASGDYHQIPAVFFENLDYGTYTVIIRVTNAAKDRCEYHLDGIRVYNPLLDDAGYTEKERGADFTDIRDLLVDRETGGGDDEEDGGLDDGGDSSEGEGDTSNTNPDNITGDTTTTTPTTGDKKVGGSVFIDKLPDDGENPNVGMVKEYNSTEYGLYGPKNEVYLAKGQSITFKVSLVMDGYYYIGLKCPTGNGDAKVKVSNGADFVKEIDINHSTDLYYEVVPDENGYITIQNAGVAAEGESTSAGLLSVTKLRVAGGSATAQLLSLTNEEAVTALSTFSIRPVEGALVVPEVQTPAITLKSPTLSLEDSIKLNIYFTMDLDVEPVEIGMLTWLQAPDVVDFATADSVFTGCNMDDITGEYYVSTAGIPAQNLGDTIYFCVYARMADGSYVYSKQVQYSPTTYAYNQLEGNADAATKALLVSILNYGAAAQKYLGYKTDALVDRDLSEDMKALVDAYNANMVHAVSAPSAAKQGAMAANGGFKAMKPTIALDGAFAINYYFTPDRDVDGQMTFYYWDAADFEAADVLDMDNATGSCVMTNKNGTFGATIDGIAAKDIDGALYACGVYTDVEGNTYSTGVLPYSVGFYCGNQAQGNDATAALATAIAVYGYYAASYFA